MQPANRPQLVDAMGRNVTPRPLVVSKDAPAGTAAGLATGGALGVPIAGDGGGKKATSVTQAMRIRAGIIGGGAQEAEAAPTVALAAGASVASVPEGGKAVEAQESVATKPEGEESKLETVDEDGSGSSDSDSGSTVSSGSQRLQLRKKGTKGGKGAGPEAFRKGGPAIITPFEARGRSTHYFTAPHAKLGEDAGTREGEGQRTSTSLSLYLTHPPAPCHTHQPSLSISFPLYPFLVQTLFSCQKRRWPTPGKTRLVLATLRCGRSGPWRSLLWVPSEAAAGRSQQGSRSPTLSC